MEAFRPARPIDERWTYWPLVRFAVNGALVLSYVAYALGFYAIVVAIF